VAGAEAGHRTESSPSPVQRCGSRGLKKCSDLKWMNLPVNFIGTITDANLPVNFIVTIGFEPGP